MHLFVVASQKEVRVFIQTSDKKQLRPLKSLVNPLAAIRKRDLIRKQAGRGMKSIGRVGSVGYSEPKRHDPHEEAINQFAKKISQFLESERHKLSFKSLAVVAEPHLLGKIRSEMSDELQRSVTNWIKKDLQKTSQKALAEFLHPKTKKSTPLEKPRVR